MITVLYTRKNSIYKQLNQDCYDIDRDARSYTGSNPLICHPPCRAWGNLQQFAKPRPDEKQLAIHAITMVRLHGGIVEHPRNSQLWKTMQIKLDGKLDKYSGWTLYLEQHWFGHRAKKPTILYIVGILPKDIPPYPIKLDNYYNGINNMGQPERQTTPNLFATWLIQTTEIIKQKKQLLL